MCILYGCGFTGGENALKCKDFMTKDFQLAWLHHIHNNPHYWVLFGDNLVFGIVRYFGYYRNCMKYFSMFSGIGGFELGIQQAYESLCDAYRSKDRGGKKNTSGDEEQGLQSTQGEEISSKTRSASKRNNNITDKRPFCIGYSEIDKYAIQIYEKHFKHKNYGDITKINEKELPDFDLLVGGVPCQSWSIAGKRGGFGDERGNMWFECFKILRAKQPKYFLFENVKGLLSHDGGKSMERICEELCECGYGIDFEVLNSKNFGVPQSRERVFIIGIRLDMLDKCQLF